MIGCATSEVLAITRFWLREQFSSDVAESLSTKVWFIARISLRVELFDGMAGFDSTKVRSIMTRASLVTKVVVYAATEVGFVASFCLLVVTNLFSLATTISLLARTYSSFVANCFKLATVCSILATNKCLFGTAYCGVATIRTYLGSRRSWGQNRLRELPLSSLGSSKCMSAPWLPPWVPVVVVGLGRLDSL